ncbi:MAG: YdcF family protein [Crocinitomicaceae bacterium]|nr:YdcF family protein [Flavobacteriales bacterium]NQZ37247.1 YdcF family protein [Crocinitomicaceae bacterium]
MSRNYSVKRRLKLVALLLFTWFSIHQVVIISDGLVDETQKTEVAVIFGNTVNVDGSLSPRLKKRLDKGIELYNSQKVSKLFVSGGLGKEGHYEGTKMSEYLISKKIPEDVIFVDNLGSNTRSTALNFKQLFTQTKSVTLVSQYHHVSRAKLAFRQVGVENVLGVHCDYFELRDFYSCFREFFAYYIYLIRY